MGRPLTVERRMTTTARPERVHVLAADVEKGLDRLRRVAEEG